MRFETVCKSRRDIKNAGFGGIEDKLKESNIFGWRFPVVNFDCCDYSFTLDRKNVLAFMTVAVPAAQRSFDPSFNYIKAFYMRKVKIVYETNSSPFIFMHFACNYMGVDNSHAGL